MRLSKYFILLAFISGCYFAPDISGFDETKWEEALEACSEYRMTAASDLVKSHKEKVLTLNQNEVKALLGNPSQHQLFNRNQKFFFYDLNCEGSSRLSLRFDALGRVKEIQIEKVNTSPDS